MPIKTPAFGLALFNIGDNLADLANVQAEQDRFVLIDRQLYGLYSIFGSGVISGWRVEAADTGDAANFGVSVSPGLGIVNLFAAETLFEGAVDQLPPNQVVYIFARQTGQTATTRSVEFFYGRQRTSPRALLLAVVVTGDSGVVSVDNSVRREIGFQSLIDEEIKNHRHRGEPSKIDLDLETKGQLPGNKIADVSASVVQRGVFDLERIPQLNHSRLADTGLFDHAEIDAMLRKLDGLPQTLMEISLANQIKEHVFLKYKFSDVDEHFLNELLFIPGITPSDQVDWDATTANVDLDSGCISGIPVEGGQSASVLWNNASSFGTAEQKSDVVIDSGGVRIARADLETQLVEGFEASQNGSALSSFTATVDAVDSESGVFADSSAKTQADYSGRFYVNQTARLRFVKEFAPSQDWSAYDRLTLNVKCATVTHGAVYLYLQSDNPFSPTSSTFEILGENEVTVNPSLGGFEERTMSLSAFAGRNAVTKMVIYADDVENEYDFYVDDVRLRKSQSYKTEGVVRYRYHAEEPVTFNSISYDATIPTGTEVRARVRVADDESDLDGTLFTGYLKNRDSFAIRGKWIEVEVVLVSDASQSLTPTLTSLELAMTVSSEDGGVAVETLEQFQKGTASNVEYVTSPSFYARIATPVTVGNVSALTGGDIVEVNEDREPVFGVSGVDLPVSEVQAYDALSSGVPARGMANPKSVQRTRDRRYVVSDTDNHRILVFDSRGTLLRAYCGANEDVDQSNEDVVVLTATYNQTTGTLWVGFSRTLSATAADFAGLKLTIGGRQIDLGEEGVTLVAGGTFTGRVAPLELTDDHRSLLDDNDDAAVLTVGPEFDVEYNQLYLARTVKVYRAPVSYHEFIYYPVYAAENDAGNLWICNATKLPFEEGSVVDPPTPTTRNLQEFNPNIDLARFSNSVYFTYDFGGHVLELSDGRLVVCGVDQQRVGRVFLDPLVGLKTVFTSQASSYPTAADEDGDYVWVAESSAVPRAGRVVKIDLNGNVQRAIGRVYTRVNSVQVLSDGNLLVGT